MFLTAAKASLPWLTDETKQAIATREEYFKSRKFELLCSHLQE